jgi:hypothetical protein
MHAITYTYLEMCTFYNAGTLLLLLVNAYANCLKLR